jgi:acyl carrier protein
MSEDEIREVVLDLLAEFVPQSDLEGLDPEGELLEVLSLDASDLLSLAVSIGTELGLEIPESDFTELSTVDAWVAYLCDRT